MSSDEPTPATKRQSPFPPTEEVVVPDGCKVCGRCDGRGMMSKYDEGWSSIVYSPELAALHPCVLCGGSGYVFGDASDE